MGRAASKLEVYMKTMMANQSVAQGKLGARPANGLLRANGPLEEHRPGLTVSVDHRAKASWMPARLATLLRRSNSRLS